ncbi:hypothetical protein BJ878DRAFT_124422 [Calycina marina]|uniref:Heme oxygenase n=1 Tax=Calycina marina TaxID=1763456 RepID=A0A9P8CDR6_9HELO|nr:hypothetical protein BJ878DRAFT_124422 [Calycina marina]
MSGDEPQPTVSSPPASSSSPTPPERRYTLSERINIETRPIHSQLNRLIIVRLPLALPPYTDNPSRYVSGILHIAPIYKNFESLWERILITSNTPDGSDTNLTENCGDSRIHSILSHLRLPGLLRASRLRTDICVLTGISEDEVQEQLETVAQNEKLAAFIAHTKESVEANPHVLLAYAWVLYMALFSGGRYLRASLEEAGGFGTSFWTRDPSPVRPESVTGDRARRRSLSTDTIPMYRHSRRVTTCSDPIGALTPGLQFFHFLGDEDGEDLKSEFKERVNETSPLLTASESEDIIREAQIIFEFMVDMVGELDSVMETDCDDIDSVRLQKNTNQRDSIAIHKAHIQNRHACPSHSLEPSHLHPSTKTQVEHWTESVATTVFTMLSFSPLWRLTKDTKHKVHFAINNKDLKSSTAGTEGEREIDVNMESKTMLWAPFGVLLLLVIWYGFRFLTGVGVVTTG